MTEGDKAALSQVFFCYKDEEKGVIPGMIINMNNIINRKTIYS